jgi:hypothetical protein
MTLREGAALGILTRQTDAMAFLQQRAECQRFGGRPVDAFAVLDRLPRASRKRCTVGERGSRPAPW